MGGRVSPERDRASYDAAYQAGRRERQRALLASSPELLKHGTIAVFILGCRCTPCRDERRRHTRAKVAARQRATAPTAARAGQLWTGADMQIATERGEDGRYVRTTTEAAMLLGRTHAAVEVLRKRCLHEPKLQRVLAAL